MRKPKTSTENVRAGRRPNGERAPGALAAALAEPLPEANQDAAVQRALAFARRIVRSRPAARCDLDVITTKEGVKAGRLLVHLGDAESCRYLESLAAATPTIGGAGFRHAKTEDGVEYTWIPNFESALLGVSRAVDAWLAHGNPETLREACYEIGEAVAKIPTVERDAGMTLAQFAVRLKIAEEDLRFLALRDPEARKRCGFTESEAAT